MIEYELIMALTAEGKNHIGDVTSSRSLCGSIDDVTIARARLRDSHKSIFLSMPTGKNMDSWVCIRCARSYQSKVTK